jgi:hypothetical protein
MVKACAGKEDTMTTITEINTRQSVSQFTNNMVYDRCCLGLLRFFGAHPNSRFSKLAIFHAIDENGSRTKVEMALIQLINEGIIKIDIENDMRLYLLTKDEPVRQLVLDMAKLDWRQWQMVVEYI